MITQGVRLHGVPRIATEAARNANNTQSPSTTELGRVLDTKLHHVTREANAPLEARPYSPLAARMIELFIFDEMQEEIFFDVLA